MIPTLFCKVGIIYNNIMGRLSYEKNLAKQIKVCYTYDVLSRVIQRKAIKLSDNSEVIETYSYNSAGNLCTACGNESFRYDANNRLTEFSGKPVTYDADGNMLEASIGKFTYDSANRLTVAGTRYYSYDVEGTRIKTQKGEDTTEFVYNVNARLSQLLIKTENNAVTKYVYGLGLIGEETSGNFKTYHFDYRGSTVAITNASGTVTDTFEYDTYGKLTAHSGSTDTQFLYNGRDGVMTEDNGLIYMRARYYSTALRRFVNADKVHGDISNALTLNRYSYVNGNPAVNVDPLGLSAERGNVSTGKFNTIDLGYGNVDFGNYCTDILMCSAVLSPIVKTTNNTKYQPIVYTYKYTSGIFLWKKENTGYVYFYRNIDRDYFDSDSFTYPDGFNEKTDLLIADLTNQQNPNLMAYQAQKVKSKYRDDIIDIMLQYDKDYDTNWERTKKSLQDEWKAHKAYALFAKSAQDVDFDNAEEGKGFWYFTEKALNRGLNKLKELF